MFGVDSPKAWSLPQVASGMQSRVETEAHLAGSTAAEMGACRGHASLKCGPNDIAQLSGGLFTGPSTVQPRQRSDGQSYHQHEEGPYTLRINSNEIMVFGRPLEFMEFMSSCSSMLKHGRSWKTWRDGMLKKERRQPAPAGLRFADHQGAAGPEHAAQGLGSNTLRYAAGPLEDDGFAVNFLSGMPVHLQQMPNANLDKLHRAPSPVPPCSFPADRGRPRLSLPFPRLRIHIPRHLSHRPRCSHPNPSLPGTRRPASRTRKLTDGTQLESKYGCRTQAPPLSTTTRHNP